MLGEVEISARVYALHFLESERHEELYIGSGVGVVGELLVVVVAIFVIAEAEGLVPAQTPFFPVCEPLHLGAGTHEELHLHLLELAHTEDKLTGHYLVAEGFAYLRDTEGDAHTACFLYVEIVDEDALSRFGAQIYFHRAVGGRAHLG